MVAEATVPLVGGTVVLSGNEYTFCPCIGKVGGVAACTCNEGIPGGGDGHADASFCQNAEGGMSDSTPPGGAQASSTPPLGPAASVSGLPL